MLAIDDERDALGPIATVLRRRYGSDYRVVCGSSPSDALAQLEALREHGEEVALVLADQWMPELTGAELLASVRGLHPNARRGLLIDWGAWADPPTAAAVLRAMALGHIDYYVMKPSHARDEQFHRTVTEFLHEWSRCGDSGPKEIAVVGERWSPRSHQVRSLLARNGVPHLFHPSASTEGRRLLERAGQEDAEAPVVVTLDGRVLVDPSNPELASAFGVSTRLDAEREFDVVVIGAGPAGLAAAVYASSEGLRTLAIERESIGGQAGSSSLIRNYLGFSRGVGGAELAQRAYQQAWVFGTRFLLMRDAVELRREGQWRAVALSDGSEALARAVVLATGATYRRLGIAELDALTGAGVFYGASTSEAQALAGQHAYVVGGGNSAGQAAMHLSRYAARVTMIVRGPSLAATMSQYLRQEIAATAHVEVLLGHQIVGGGGDGRLERLTLRERASGEERAVDAAALFVLIGARPHAGWLPDAIERDDWGWVLTGPGVTSEGGRWPLERAPHPFETSLPRVFAVGDVRDRSVARVAAAVGDGSVVIRQVLECLEQDGVAGAAPLAAGR